MPSMDTTSNAPLAGKVALVTGASGGIGRGIAERLGRDGATVVVNYTSNQQEADEVVATIQSSGGEAVALQANLGNVSEIRRLFQATVDRFGQLDILVNNAGIATASPIAEVTEADYQKVFDINVRGVLFALQEAARRMGDGGRIVNISSTTSILPGCRCCRLCCQ